MKLSIVPKVEVAGKGDVLKAGRVDLVGDAVDLLGDVVGSSGSS